MSDDNSSSGERVAVTVRRRAWRQSGKTTPLVLRRIGSADEPVRIESRSRGTLIQR